MADRMNHDITFIGNSLPVKHFNNYVAKSSQSLKLQAGMWKTKGKRSPKLPENFQLFPSVLIGFCWQQVHGLPAVSKKAPSLQNCI
jgi:hypothetical protein